MSLCNDVTLGLYALHSLLLIYKSVFIPTILYSSQAWTNITNEDLHKLKTVQLKYLKRTPQVPNSACNCIVYLELGVLPIEYEIHIRKLVFLHHIVNTVEEDPVKKVYHEQRKYEQEGNWANESVNLREKYEVTESDEEIKVKSKEEWKTQVKRQVKKRALTDLNQES